jgi:glycosyltransferase involved in cell wall biosynthesis
MQELIIVTRIFSGIEDALVSNHWEHSGTPAYYHFIRKLDLNDKFVYKLYLLSPNAIGNNKYRKVSFDNLNVTAQVIPYYSIIFSSYSSFIKKIEFFYNKFIQYALVLVQTYNHKCYYIDRDNILLSFILLKISKYNVVITRLLGVPPGLYEHLTCRNNIYSKIIRWVFDNNRSYFICTNDGSFAEATKEKIKNNRFYLLFNGVDKGFTSVSNNKKENSEIITISYISRIVAVKGHINFIKSLGKLKEKDRFRVYIIGDGELKEKCQRLVKSYGLDDNIIFTGRLTHSESMNYLCNSDILIAINYDGSFGNSVLEAAHMGIPVVTLAHKSFSKEKYPFFKFIDNNGKIDEYLAVFIEKFVHSKPLQDSMSKKSIEFSNSNLLDWDERINAELDIILDLCKRNTERCLSPQNL